jgi:predicted CoA-binding protein
VPVSAILVYADSASAGLPALWLQQGIASPDARRTARDAGLLYVEDECAAVVRSLHQIRKHRTI